MKRLVLLFPLILDAQAVIRTVCASGCDHTTLAAAVTAADGAACAPQIIELAAGQTFTENVVVPYSGSCAAPWVIRSSRWRELPARRVAPGDAALMANLRNLSATSQALEIRRGLVIVDGLDIQHNPASSLSLFGLVNIGQFTAGNYCDGTAALCPRGVTILRSWVHGNAQQDGLVRAIQVSGYNVTVEDSYISEAKSTATDSQGVACPFSNCWGLAIINSYVEAATENVYMGGAANSGQSWHPSPGESPRGLFVLGSHITKKPEWLRYSGAGAPSGACLPGSYYQNTTTSAWHLCSGGTWGAAGSGAPGVVQYVVKNLVECKDCQGLQLVGNVVENSWQQAQNGYGLLLNQTSGDTSLTSNVKAGTPDYNITDVLLRGNLFQRVATGMSIGALDTPLFRTRPARVTLAHNNLIIGGNYLRTQPTIPKGIELNTMSDFRMERNTFVPVDYLHTIWISNDDAQSGFRGSSNVRENIVCSLDWVTPGLFGSWFGVLGATTSAMQASAYVAPGAFFDWRRNAVSGPGSITTGAGATWPSDHVTASTCAGLLTDPTTGNYAPTGPAVGAAADGGNLGADQALVAALTAGATSGARNSALLAGIRAARLEGTTVSVRFTAPSSAACTVVAAASEAFSPVGSVSQTRNGLEGVATITGAGAARFARVTCGTWTQDISL